MDRYRKNPVDVFDPERIERLKVDIHGEMYADTAKEVCELIDSLLKENARLRAKCQEVVNE